MAAALLRYAEKRQGARVLQDCDIAFDNGACVRPDIVLVREHRIGIIGRRSVHGAPDLAVEIACESSARELRAKMRIYAALEVREVWLVSPESETVEVLAWTEAGYVILGRYGRCNRIRSRLLPDMKLPLWGIFRRDE
jgi:Uma2 family endonuclease